MSKWDGYWMARWFYHTIPFEAGSDSAKALLCRRQVLTLDQVEAEARRMIGDVSVVEYSQLLTRQAAGRANRLAPRKRRVPASSDSDADDEDDVEEPDGEEEGEEEEEAEAVAEKVTNEAAEDRVDTPGYTPTPSPGHNETGVESNSSPLRRKDLEGAKTLVAFSSGKAAKGGPILAAHCSTERIVRARLDGFKNRLRAKDDEIGRKNLEMEALANTLKEAKTENRRLQSEFEKGNEARAEVDRLKAELEKEKAHSAALTDYYNLTEPKMEALRLKVSKAEASAVEESQRFSREMAKTTESGKTACQTLRLALTDMGAKV
ncbi:uncharacterized protein [Oryza sativa Japonica Group]|uniref:uncharacterized protein n=1 Tax=Oryza sativa subsp. japonica TaxID=39947 RepID=UPI00339CF0E0